MTAMDRHSPLPFLSQRMKAGTFAPGRERLKFVLLRGASTGPTGAIPETDMPTGLQPDTGVALMSVYSEMG